MRIQHVQRHLHRVEAEAVLGSYFQHIQMNVRIFVTGESDVANLARFLGLQNGFHGSALRKYAIGIIEANDFMMLHQIDVVCLEAFQTSFDLPLRNLFSAAINFCHQKYLLTISVFQGLTHPHFTLAFVVVPTVIHERNAAINGGAHQADALVLGEPMLRNMEPPHPNGGDPLSGVAAPPPPPAPAHGKPPPRHTSREFVAFLQEVVALCPPGQQIHIILDNLSAHKTQAVREFLPQHPRVRFHFTPTYSSWLNQVEIWFAKIEREVIARGIFTSVSDLARKLRRYINAYSANARPIQWKYSDPTRRIRSNELTATGH